MNRTMNRRGARRGLAASSALVAAIALTLTSPGAASASSGGAQEAATTVLRGAAVAGNVPALPLAAGAADNPEAATAIPDSVAPVESVTGAVEVGGGPGVGFVDAIDEVTPQDVIAGFAEPNAVGSALGGSIGLEGDDVPVVADGTAVEVEQIDLADFGLNEAAFGLRLSQGSPDATATWASIDLDISGIRYAHGGDYGGRLQLVAFPECILERPEDPECNTSVSLPSLNLDGNAIEGIVPVDAGSEVILTGAAGLSSMLNTNVRSGDLLANVRGILPMAGGQAGQGTIVAAVAGAAGPGGTFAKTDLPATGQWGVSDQTGAFTYSVPLDVPPAAVGPTPSLALTYNSQTIDGHTPASNGQGSWIADGWDLDFGYIERSFNSCTDEGVTTKGNDLCWAAAFTGSNYAVEGSTYAPTGAETAAYTMVLGGASYELLPIGVDRYTTSSDTGMVIERVRRGASTNGDNDGEYFRVFTPDGSVFYFGYGHNGSTPTNSVATVQQWANDGVTVECTGTCRQAYRWMLDVQVDSADNAMALYYKTETNSYAQSGTSTTVSYTSAIYPASIEYGGRFNGNFAAPAVTATTAKVEFVLTGRCVENTLMDPSAITATNGEIGGCATPGTAAKASYPDVPTDLICSGSCNTTSQRTPAFFRTKRLARIDTFVKTGSTWASVASHALYSTYPLPAGADGRTLWLDGVYTRYTNGTTSTTADDLLTYTTTFDGKLLANRVDWTTDAGKLEKRRVVSVRNAMGGVVTVDYERPFTPGGTGGVCPSTGRTSATPADNLSPTWYRDNRWDCFRVTNSAGDFGLYHKYLVEAVTVSDKVAGQDSQVYRYTYSLGASPHALWGYADSIFKTRDSAKPDAQDYTHFFGYPVVTVTTGSGATERSTTTYYHQGRQGSWDGQAATVTNGISAVVDLPGSATDPTDLAPLAGKPAMSVSRDSDGNVVASSVFTYNVVPRVNGPYDHDSTVVQTTGVVSTVTDPDGVGQPSRSSSQTVAYDTTRPWLQDTVTTVPDLATPLANIGITTMSYTVDDPAYTAWSTPTTARFYVLPTGQSSTLNGVTTSVSTVGYLETNTEAGGTSLAPVMRGRVTSERTLATTDGTTESWLESTAAYDSFGRILTAKGPAETVNGTSVSWSYTDDNAADPLDLVTVTNQVGWTSKQWTSRTFGQLVRSVDANGDYTHFGYDAGGMLVAAWAPAQTRNQAGVTSSTQPGAGVVPTVSYRYDIYAPALSIRTKPTVVVSAQFVGATGTNPAVTSQASTVRRSYEFYDGFGRVVESHAPAVDAGGGRLVTQVDYDSVGRQVRVSEPYLDTAPAQAASGLKNGAWAAIPRYSETEYDSLDRVTGQNSYVTVSGQREEIELSSTAYGLSTTTVTGITGASSVTTFDALGRVTELRQSPTPGSPQAVANEQIVTSYSYVTEQGGSRVTVTDDAGQATVFTSDLAGRRVGLIDPNSGASTYTYNASGQVETISSDTGVITMSYDALSRLVARTSNITGVGASSSASWDYDIVGHRGVLESESATTVTPVGALTTTKAYTYTADHRPDVVTTTLPNNPLLGEFANQSYSSDVEYDPLGQVQSVQESAFAGLPALTQSYTLDRFGRPTAMSVTESGTSRDLVTGVTFDDRGRLESRTYGNDLVKSITYDERWNTVSTVETATPDGSSKVQDDRLAYNADGQLVSVTDAALAAPVIHQFAYDGFDRLSASWALQGTTPGVQGSAVALSGANEGLGYSLSYSYTEAGQIHSVVDAIAGTTATYGYTDASHPAAVTSVSTTGASSVVTATDGFESGDYEGGSGSRWVGGWSEAGDGTASASEGLLRADQGALELELGDGLSPYGTVSRDVDAASATAGTVSFDAAAVAATMDADDVLVVTVTPDANASEAIVTQYTGAELSSVASHVSVDVVDALPAAVLTVSFGVLEGSVGGTAPEGESFRVDNVVVELTIPDVPDVSTYGYDTAGRLTSRSGVAGAADYQWDATSSLVASSGAGGDRVYVYDASGQRVAQIKVSDLTSSATALESTVYVGSVEATDTEPATVGGVSAQRFVAFGGATVAVESREATGVTSWALVLGDVQGSAQVMVELVPGATTTGWEDYDPNNHGVSRSAYTPFGATRADGLDINRGWLGQVEDEGTGLTYLNARYYDPATMRFISPDPLMNPGDPRTLDPYRYANNNPVAYTDATGLTAACSGLSSTNEKKCLEKFNSGWKQKAPGKGGSGNKFLPPTKSPSGAVKTPIAQPAPSPKADPAKAVFGISLDTQIGDWFDDDQAALVDRLEPEDQDRYIKMWVTLQVIRGAYLEEYPDKEGLIDSAMQAAATNWVADNLDTVGDGFDLYRYHKAEWQMSVPTAVYQAPLQGLNVASEATKKTGELMVGTYSGSGAIARGVITISEARDVMSLADLLNSGLDLGKVDDFHFEFETPS